MDSALRDSTADALSSEILSGMHEWHSSILMPP